MLFFAAAGTSAKPRSFKRVCNFTPFVFTWLLGDVSAEALLMYLMFCLHPAMGVLQDAKEEENGEDESEEEEEESEDESLVYLVTVLSACLYIVIACQQPWYVAGFWCSLAPSQARLDPLLIDGTKLIVLWCRVFRYVW